MFLESIQNYLVNGYQLLSGQAEQTINSWSSLFNLVGVLDLLLLLLLVWFIWSKIRYTMLIKALPNLIGVVTLLLVSKLFGFNAVFYAALVLLIVFLMAAMLIYHQELQRILESSLEPHGRMDRVKLLDVKELYNFIKQLNDTVTILAKNQVSSLIIIKTTRSVGRLTEGGIQVFTQFSKDLVIDIFSHRSNLSAGAIVVDNGTIISIGSRLGLPASKKLIFSPDNLVLKHIAENQESLVIITNKNSDNVAVLHKDNSYSKLAVSSLDRVLKTILIPR